MRGVWCAVVSAWRGARTIIFWRQSTKRVAKPVDWVKAGTLRGKFSAAARKTVAVPRLPR